MPDPTADADPVAALAALFRVLADPHRLRILALLNEFGERTVTDIGTALGQSQPAVSHHLRELKNAGLIDYRRDGKFNHYRLDEDGIAGVFDAVSPDGPARLLAGGIEVLVRRK